MRNFDVSFQIEHCSTNNRVAGDLRRPCDVTSMLFFRPILGDEPLVVNFEGLEYMNDDPGMVDVLYAKIGLGAPR